MIAVVNYDAGNVGSVLNALRYFGVAGEVTADPQKIRAATGVIFPGQGRAGPAMKSLNKSGLSRLLPVLTQPFLGICLGMQLMVEHLEEDNQTGLAIIPGKCSRLKNVKPVPHMGWNQVEVNKASRLLSDLKTGFYQYFAHSYAVSTEDPFVVATTGYGGEFASVISKDNFYGAQFHPEKSGKEGLQLLKNFLTLCEKQGSG
jgi:glutamine amidotransferase